MTECSTRDSAAPNKPAEEITASVLALASRAIRPIGLAQLNTELDCMDRICVRAEIEEAFSTDFSDDEVRGWQSIADVARSVEKRIER